jgi:hypothetical protein
MQPIMETPMPVSNPAAATAATPEQQPANIQQLIGMLGSLMPLLLRFQSHGLFQPPIGIDGPALAQPALDHQAAVNFVSDLTAISLRNLSAYLETYVGTHAGLEICVPIVTQAARSYAARDYAQAFDMIWQAYRVIAAVRASDPQLPPLQAGDPAGVVASAAPTSIH